MAMLRCEAIHWVSDEPQPGWIEVALRDSDGRIWRLFDKPPIFDSEVPLTKDTELPVLVRVRVDVVKDGDPMLISTAPDGVASDEGQQAFWVAASDVDR